MAKTGRKWLALSALMAAAWFAPSGSEAGTIVRFQTVMGNIDIQLYDMQMPVTVGNFLHYVTTGKYNSSVIHRNSDTTDTPGGPLRDFVVQGGGYFLADPPPPIPPNPPGNMSASGVVTLPPINDEPGGGVAGPSNLRGTIAMAKSGPNTVTSQWFINQGNNSFLDNPTRSDGGFSAFGSVLSGGMTVVDEIGDLNIPSNYGINLGAPFNDLPLRNFSGTAVNQIRVQHTVTLTTAKVLNLSPADFDRNGFVNMADLNILRSNFGLASGALFDKGDADMDGDVDGRDYMIFQQHYGETTTPISAVPEPGAATLAAVGLAALLGWGRRAGRVRA